MCNLCNGSVRFIMANDRHERFDCASLQSDAAETAPWLIDMVWRDIAFAHWRADPQWIAHLLPADVALDLYAGEAWLSVVPFRLTRVRARFSPLLPGFADVAEINLRTYVRVGAARGIWFFSLDASSPIAVRCARLATSLPYYDARIRTAVARGRFAARFRPPHSEHVCARDSLEEYLHERYQFFTTRGSRVITGHVRHRPWTIGELAIEISSNTLGDLIGYPLDGPPAFAYFSRELPVRATAVERLT